MYEMHRTNPIPNTQAYQTQSKPWLALVPLSRTQCVPTILSNEL